MVLMFDGAEGEKKQEIGVLRTEMFSWATAENILYKITQKKSVKSGTNARNEKQRKKTTSHITAWGKLYTHQHDCPQFQLFRIDGL